MWNTKKGLTKFARLCLERAFRQAFVITFDMIMYEDQHMAQWGGLWTACDTKKLDFPPKTELILDTMVNIYIGMITL